jgi:5-methylcytosine-specific restriction protein A
MPYAAKRYCNRTGCHQFAIPGSSYCAEHQQSTAHDYDAARRNEFEHEFYVSPEWRAARARKLQKDPLCEDCLADDRVTAATMVHHEKSVRDFPELALVESNLHSLCDPCHNKKHPEKGGTHDD